MYKNLYVVNATAIKKGGGLTLLRDFLSVARNTAIESFFIIFSGADLDEFISENISIIKVKTNGIAIGGIKRIFWDSFGLYLYCKVNRIKPDLIISIQNTGVVFPKVKQLIYYHQLIPLYNIKWNIFRKDESLLFFYKNLYPLFIKLLLNRNTEFVVQQEFIKKLFADKFNIREEKIHVIVPDVNFNFDLKIEKINLDIDKLHIFYPTNIEIYKNYDILFKAISQLEKSYPEVFEKIILHITLDNENKNLKRRVSMLNISDKVDFLGRLSHKEVISYYNSVNLLVFPSYIETIGLPLIEAAYFGLPILVADLDYAHEILKDYQGANYVTFNDIDLWATAIKDLSKNNQKVESLKKNSSNNSWNDFLELSKNIITNNSSN